MTTPLIFPTAGETYAYAVRSIAAGPEWNAAFLTANRGRFTRLPQDQKRELWIAMKETGGIGHD